MAAGRGARGRRGAGHRASRYTFFYSNATLFDPICVHTVGIDVFVRCCQPAAAFEGHARSFVPRMLLELRLICCYGEKSRPPLLSIRS
jgi:hypothetical protein